MNEVEPIQNPELAAAIDRLAEDPTGAAKDEVLALLPEATLLLLHMGEKLEFAEVDEEGKVLPEGSRLAFAVTESEDGETYLPAFTDWQAIGDYVEGEVTGVGMPAVHIFIMALEGDTFEGVVINPGGNALPLSKPILQFLLASAGFGPAEA